MVGWWGIRDWGLLLLRVVLILILNVALICISHVIVMMMAFHRTLSSFVGIWDEDLNFFFFFYE